MSPLSSELTAAIVGGLFTLAVALLASFVQGRQAFRLARQQLEHQDRANAELSKTKYLEELFVATRHWFDVIVMDHLNYRRVMDGVFTYNQALDLTIQSGAGSTYDYKRIEMIITLHFPRLLSTYREIMQTQDQANAVREAFKRVYLAGRTVSSEHSKELGNTIEILLEKQKRLEQEITALTT